MAAVIFLKTLSQGARGLQLQFGVIGGADGQTPAEKFALAEIAAQLPTDFVGEVVSRRQALAEGFEIAVLDRQQRRSTRRVIGRLIDIAVLEHLAQNKVPAIQRPFLGPHGVVGRWRLGQNGQIGGLFNRQFRQGLVEIGLCGGGHPIGILPEENLVQVQFQNAVLGQGFLNPRGKDQFLDLTLARALTPQEKVLHHLLGDGRGPAHVLATALEGVIGGRGNAARVIALVAIEILVLCRDKRLFDDIGDFIGGREQAAFFGEFVDQTPLTRINPADGFGGIDRQILMIGQIARIHPEQRADHDDRPRDAKRDKAEQTAKDG